MTITYFKDCGHPINPQYEARRGNTGCVVCGLVRLTSQQIRDRGWLYPLRDYRQHLFDEWVGDIHDANEWGNEGEPYRYRWLDYHAFGLLSIAQRRDIEASVRRTNQITVDWGVARRSAPLNAVARTLAGMLHSGHITDLDSAEVPAFADLFMEQRRRRRIGVLWFCPPMIALYWLYSYDAEGRPLRRYLNPSKSLEHEAGSARV